jgi:hypothetical protein
MSHHFLYGVFVTFPTILGGFLWHHRRFHSKEYAKLIDLQDAPFKFKIIFDDGNDYAVFDLGGGTTLWCDYNFGIKSDGVYGVNELKLAGLNGRRRGNAITLAIGQSIFPIIKNMDAFEAWANTKAFEFKWEQNFREVWDDMKKKLDNLRILETKSKEKEKKSK